MKGMADPVEFMRRFDRAIDSGRGDLSVITIHVDSHDMVQRNHGEKIASLLLAHFGRLVSMDLKHEDCLAHFGDGDFMLLLPDEDAEAAKATLARIDLTLMCNPYPLPAGNGSIRIRISSECSQVPACAKPEHLRTAEPAGA